MISGSNEELQQQLEYTLLKPDCHSCWISKMQSGRQDTLEEGYAIRFCFKLGKNATETYGNLQTAFRPSCMNRASVFEWHKRFKEARESVRDDERCGRSKKVNALFKSVQWHFHMDLASVHNSILVTNYWTKMGIKRVPHLPYSPDLAPLTFHYFLSSESVVKRQLRRWKRLWRRSLTRSHKRTFIRPSRSCWNGTTSALQSEKITSKGSRVSCVYYRIKVPIRKKSGNLFNEPSNY